MYSSKLSIFSAFKLIIGLLSRPQNGSNDTGPTALPPQHFKGSKLVNFKNSVIQLEMNKWLVVTMADGCATNAATGNQRSNYLEILSQYLRCVVHLADEAIKRMANSESRNVSEQTEFLPYF